MQCLICDEDMKEGIAVRFRYGIVRRNKSCTEYFIPIEYEDGSEIQWAHKACVIKDSIRITELGEVAEPCPMCRRNYEVEGGPFCPGETVLEAARGVLFESGDGETLGFDKESGGYACFDCTSQEWRGVTQRIMNLHLEAPF